MRLVTLLRRNVAGGIVLVSEATDVCGEKKRWTSYEHHCLCEQTADLMQLACFTERQTKFCSFWLVWNCFSSKIFLLHKINWECILCWDAPPLRMQSSPRGFCKPSLAPIASWAGETRILMYFMYLFIYYENLNHQPTIGFILLECPWVNFESTRKHTNSGMPQEAVEDFCRLHGVQRWRDYFSFFFLANAVEVPTTTGHKNAFYGVYTCLSLSMVLFWVIFCVLFLVVSGCRVRLT